VASLHQMCPWSMHGSKAGYTGVSKSSVAHGFDGDGDGDGVGATTISSDTRGVQAECVGALQSMVPFWGLVA
jgi:hypothetical protein